MAALAHGRTVVSLYAVLGETELTIIAWLDGFEARFAAQWPEQGLIGGKSLVQHTGYAPDEVRLRVLLHAQWCDPGLELARLKARLDEAQPLAFVLGTGEYRGRFVLTDLSAVTRQTDGHGALIALEAEIALKESIGDPAEPAPPAVLLPGWQTPVSAAGDVIDAPVQTVLADSPAGDAAEAIAAAIGAMGRAAQAASDLSNLVAVAQGDPLAAVALAGPLSASIGAVAEALPVQAVAGISAISSAAGALAIARGSLDSAAACLASPAPGAILAHAGHALAHTRGALAALEATRGVFAQATAAIASRSYA